MGKIRERAERLDAEPGLIQLGFDREQRAAFDPAVPDAQVFRKTVLVVGGAQELVGFPQARPVFFGERGVAAFDQDRKSTRLNSRHGYISYAVFCLEQKNTRPNSSHSHIASAAFSLKQTTQPTSCNWLSSIAIPLTASSASHRQRRMRMARARSHEY